MPLYFCKPALIKHPSPYAYVHQRFVKHNTLPYQELRVGSVRTVIMHGGRSAYKCHMAPGKQFELDKGCTGKLFARFMAHFTTCIHQRFQKDPSLYYLTVEYRGSSRHKSYPAWREMAVGDYFYSIDIDNAYWQAGHKLGYISDTLFKRYFKDDVFKMPMRLCFSFLSRPSSVHYYDGSGVEERSIVCENTFLRDVYANVRNRLHLAIRDARNAVSGRQIQYTIDSIDVATWADVRLVVKSLHAQNGFVCKITRCRKISAAHYVHDGKKVIFLR